MHDGLSMRNFRALEGKPMRLYSYWYVFIATRNVAGGVRFVFFRSLLIDMYLF